MENEIINVNQPLSVAQVRGQVNLIQQVMKSVMKNEVHYGVIPGCKKPTLYKAGSEKILATFRLACDPEVEDLSTKDIFRYRIKTRLTNMATGEFVGSGLGECSSAEDKYQWRFAVCDAEFEATDELRKRNKYKRDGSITKQVRTNPADIANTILKMAKKRSQIDATLTATAASDIFDQDIEDLPPEMQQEISENQPKTKPKAEPPKSKSETNGDKISEAQSKRFFAICKTAGMENQDMKNWLSYYYELESSRDIPKSQYAEICEKAGKWTKHE